MQIPHNLEFFIASGPYYKIRAASRRVLEQFAEIDRAKTTFFSNINGLNSSGFDPGEIEQGVTATLDVTPIGDITDRKKIEEAVKQRAAQYLTLLNQAPLGVFLLDADFRIRDVNPTALRVFSDIPNLIDRDFEEVIRLMWEKKYADEVVAVFRNTLRTGEPYQHSPSNQPRKESTSETGEPLPLRKYFDRPNTASSLLVSNCFGSPNCSRPEGSSPDRLPA
jgi:PAS domain-containing protein